MARIPLIDLTTAVNARPPPPPPSTTTNSKKRKAEDEPVYVPNPDDWEGPYFIDKTPNQVRGMVNRFLESGAMTKGDFCNALGVSDKSLRGFLQSSGMKGIGSDSYSEAWRFFKQREEAGVKMPRKEAAKVAKGKAVSDSKNAEATDATGEAGTAHPAAQAKPGKKNVGVVDINSVELDGEKEDRVEVYDTCDEIRKKINAHLKKPGVTAASFCRDLTSQVHDGSRIQAGQLTSFRGKKGPTAGNTSNTFYAAYVYFEKLRIAEKRPKSKHRQEMEEVWGREGGLNTEHLMGHILCHRDERLYEDQ